MSRILITPEQVDDAGKQFDQASQQSQDMVNRLQSLMTGMQPQWEGMTSQRFYQEYEQWRSAMTQFVQLLSDIGTELHAISTRFSQTDGQ